MSELELLRVLAKMLIEYESEVLWEYCDCGCPNESAPSSRESVKLIGILKAVKELESMHNRPTE